jgi:hypothetical protein
MHANWAAYTGRSHVPPCAAHSFCLLYLSCFGDHLGAPNLPPPCSVAPLLPQLVAAGLPQQRMPPCELCPVVGGPMKRTETGGFCHVLCALWLPEAGFADVVTREPIEGTREVRACLTERSAHALGGVGSRAVCGAFKFTP